MNCHQAHAIWDDARDGSLDAEQHVGFDEHLHECAACGELWRRESRLLETIAHEAEPTDGPLFAQRVMQRMAAGGDGESIMRRMAPWAALAAAIALAFSIWATLNLPAGRADHNATPVATNLTPPRGGAVGGPAHPVSVLVEELSRSVDQPQRLRDAIEHTTSMLSFDRLADLIEHESDPLNQTPTPNPRG